MTSGTSSSSGRDSRPWTWPPCFAACSRRSSSRRKTTEKSRGCPGQTAGLADQLQRTIADLDTYIKRRAEQLATPRIASAEADAQARVGAKQWEIERRDDLVAELRRRIEVLEDQLDDARIRLGDRPDAYVVERREASDSQEHAARAARLAKLPEDTRPMPSVEPYNQLLTRTNPR